MHRPALALLLLLAACGRGDPLPSVAHDLPQTPDTLVAAGVVNISYAVPLSGDRWALLAVEERQVLVADFAAGTVVPFPGITREDVPEPTVLFSHGDTIAVGDWGLSRLTRWVEGAGRVEAVPVPAGVRGALPRARDAAGQWYFQIPPRAGTNGEGKRDSTVLVRSDPLLTRFDTVARLSAPDLVVVEDGYGRSLVPRALGGEDRWGVYPDGTLWVARIRQNRIEWYSPTGGKPVVSRPLPDPVLTLSDMDKEIYLQRFPEIERDNARQSTLWSPIKPPFERAMVGPAGRLWLFKSAPALDSIRRFQVVVPRGVAAVVSVPSRGMALALSNEGILMGEEFPGGIRLLRYRFPAQTLADLPTVPER